MQNHCNASVISPPRTPGGNRTHGHLDLRQAALPLAYGGICWQSAIRTRTDDIQSIASYQLDDLPTFSSLSAFWICSGLQSFQACHS